MHFVRQGFGISCQFHLLSIRCKCWIFLLLSDQTGTAEVLVVRADDVLSAPLASGLIGVEGLLLPNVGSLVVRGPQQTRPPCQRFSSWPLSYYHIFNAVKSELMLIHITKIYLICFLLHTAASSHQSHIYDENNGQ